MLVFVFFSSSALAATPNEDEAVYWTAETYFKAKDFPSAIKYYSEIIEKYPSSRFLVFSKYSRAWAYDEIGDYEKALSEFEGVAADFKDHPLAIESKYKIGQCLYELKRYESASKVLKEFVERYNS